MTTRVGAGLAVLMIVSATWAAPVTLYVAPNGNDAWTGTLREANANGTDGPLATPMGARNAIRRLRGQGTAEEATVRFRGGVYRLTEPLVLCPQDSRTTYAAVPGETPVLSGGRVVSGWTRGPGALWTTHLPDVANGAWEFQQLFVNGQRRPRARSPNEGYFTIVRKGPPARDPATGRETPQDRSAFVFRPGDIKAWPNVNDVHVIVYHSWETSRLRIKQVDEAASLVHFTGLSCWPFERWGAGQRYVVENVPEALDAAGEWYLDKGTGTLRYWPLPGEDMATAEVVAPALRRLVELRGDATAGLLVERVVLRGLTLQHQDWVLEPQGHSDAQAVVTAPAAVLADGAIDGVVEGCEVAHVGDYGVWFRQGCRRNLLQRNRLFDLGVGGIRIGQAALPPCDAVTSAENRVDNNHLFDGGHVYPAGVGIWVAQSYGNVISHNAVHDFNYSGLSIGWNWGDEPNRCHHNTIEFNHVHHVMRGVLSDGGAIYTLGTSPGSIIRNNLFHDVWPYHQPPLGWGIYLDATTSGYLVENNVVYHVLSGGLMYSNGGHENAFRNNVFALSANHVVWPTWERRPNTFERNLVSFTQGTLFVPFTVRSLEDRLKAGESLGTWDRNVYWGPVGEELRFHRRDLAAWQALGLDAHSVVADPGFVDVAARDFRLRPDSPALKLGFQPIDLSTVGPYGDAAWVAEAREVKHPPTVLPAPPPAPKPTPVRDDFEGTAAGLRPERVTVSGEESEASVRVTDEAAAGGRHSLKVSDCAGLKHVWEPHLFYQPHFTTGTVRQSVELLLTPGALLYTEWRDEGDYPANIGPSVTFQGDGRVQVGERTVARVPADQWIRVEIEAALGKDAARTFALTLTPRGGAPQRFAALPFAGAAFRELHWLGFVSTAETKTAFYLDEVSIGPP